MEETTERLLKQRKEKINELKDSGVTLYPNDFKISHTVNELKALALETPHVLNDESSRYAAAGRIMAVNKMGKSSFVRFRDGTGQLQAYFKKNMVGEERYDFFKKLDIGDFVGIEGPLFKTRTGELTIAVSEFKVLSKTVRPLPEKFHGIKDPEKRYRKRYLDLVMNDGTRDVFIRRSRIVSAMRRFLEKEGFMEVETPMMQPLPGGAEATPFKTWHNALSMELYLRIAPELYLKRLLVGGFDRVFEINRNFRNEGVSTNHNPEFTMVEFYQAYADYEDMMALTEKMFATISKTVTGSEKIEYQGKEIDFSPGWPRRPLMEALVETGGVAREILHDREALLQFAEKNGVEITKRERHGKILTKLFDKLVEPHLIQPTFITGYPTEVSPLSRKNDADPRFTDRFELFIAGKEIANGFSEINDPADQYSRFLQQLDQREAGDEEAHLMDADYIEALEYGMPPAGGEGIGIDRLVMILTNTESIREVILFPHMRKN